MKRFLIILITLLSLSSIYAHDYLYIESFQIKENQESVTVPIKAQFDKFVSKIKVELKLPEGLTITSVRKGADFTVIYYDKSGHPLVHVPSSEISPDKTKFLALTTVTDYYEGEKAGPAKWLPGESEIWYITMKIDPQFNGGIINVHSETNCKEDKRYWMETCSGCISNTTTEVTVKPYNNINEYLSDKPVESIKYYNLAGQEIYDPKGVAIKVITYTDKTKETTKIIQR